jgi:hypothetical protein
VRGASGGTINFGVQDRNASGFGDLEIYDLSVKELAGNHALQATTASRPVLRARYNLLTYSEQFDNAGWSKSNTTITANATTAPDGTTTADKIAISAATAVTSVNSNAGVTVIVGTVTVTSYFKADGVQYANVGFIYSAGIYSGTQFDLSNGTVVRSAAASYTSPSGTITAVGSGWYRCSHTVTVTTTTIYPLAVPSNALWTAGEPRQTLTGDGTSGAFVWGADLRTGSSAGTYQRIAAATDYDTVGFAPYLAFDGVDDFLSAAYVQSAYPLTLTAGINNDSIATASGAFVSVAQSDSVYKISRDNAVGATDAQDRNAATITTGVIAQAGNKFVLSQFETSTITQQVNGGTANTIANTNSFGTSVSIFLGKARPTNLFSSAKDYGVVITNTVLTAAEKDSLKNYMGGKMGVVI